MITAEQFMLKRGHNDFEVVAIGRNQRVFMVVTGKGGSSLWVCPGLLKFMYYTIVVERRLEGILYMQQVRMPIVSESGGHGYLHHWSLEWNKCTD